MKKCSKMKKIMKIVAICIAIAGFCTAVCVCVKKYLDKKKKNEGNTEENYVSCSCCDEEFKSETVAE